MTQEAEFTIILFSGTHTPLYRMLTICIYNTISYTIGVWIQYRYFLYVPLPNTYTCFMVSLSRCVVA